MISLSKLYSNKDDIFPPIKFHNGLNIVYASVSKDKKSSKNHSHSVGKTTLLEVIDYLLVKKIDKKHFFNKHKIIFSSFIFYLQIKTSNSLFVTIRRDILGKIWIKTHDSDIDARDLTDESWDHTGLGVDKARTELSRIFGLQVSPQLATNFRKGLRYCFRRQGEFRDTFKVKSVNEKASAWKPYLGGLLGIDEKLISSKLAIDEKVNKYDELVKEIKGVTESSSQEIEAEIQVASIQLEEEKIIVENFNFLKADQDALKIIIEDLDIKISTFNRNKYIVDRKILSINKSLKTEYCFDLEQVKKLYDEIALHLPDQLVKDYEDLVALNVSLTKERNERLKKTKLNLEYEASILNEELYKINIQRSDLAIQLLDEDSFLRYKELQQKLSIEEARIEVLKSKLDKLDSAANIEEMLEAAILEQSKLVNILKTKSKRISNKTLEDVGTIFSSLVKRCVELNAYLYVEINNIGNPEFKTGLHDHTSQDEGESYRQIISSCFDVSILSYYSDVSFYRFAYHDGIFESINDSLKLNVLEQWREIALQHNLQLIITLHDSDLPLDTNGEKIILPKQEVICELNDRGDDGRLFKIPAF
ncbi:TPA: DUF2326 domain-containing protein [Photobacterium damselae]